MNLLQAGAIYREVTTMKHLPLKTVTRLSILFSVLGLLLFVIGICVGTTAGLVVLAAGLLVLVGTIIFIALFCRCPYCGGFLKVGYRHLHCPHCGTYID